MNEIELDIMIAKWHDSSIKRDGGNHVRNLLIQDITHLLCFHPASLHQKTLFSLEMITGTEPIRANRGLSPVKHLKKQEVDPPLKFGIHPLFSGA